MAKTCPSCGYTPIGPFIDNCPLCAEPVRNARSGPAGVSLWPASMPPWLKWVVGGLVAAVVGVFGCCGLGAWFLNMATQGTRQALEQAQTEAEAKRKAQTVAVAAEQLAQEFQDDPAAAHQKYRDKHLEISGMVEQVGRNRDDTPFVVLHAGDENARLKIECFFDTVGEQDEAQLRRLGRGRAVTVRGEYDGQVSNVHVRKCVLVKESGGGKN